MAVLEEFWGSEAKTDSRTEMKKSYFCRRHLMTSFVKKACFRLSVNVNLDTSPKYARILGTKLAY